MERANLIALMTVSQSIRRERNERKTNSHSSGTSFLTYFELRTESNSRVAPVGGKHSTDDCCATIIILFTLTSHNSKEQCLLLLPLTG